MNNIIHPYLNLGKMKWYVISKRQLWTYQDPLMYHSRIHTDYRSSFCRHNYRACRFQQVGNVYNLSHFGLPSHFKQTRLGINEILTKGVLSTICSIANNNQLYNWHHIISFWCSIKTGGLGGNSMSDVTLESHRVWLRQASSVLSSRGCQGQQRFGDTATPDHQNSEHQWPSPCEKTVVYLSSI